MGQTLPHGVYLPDNGERNCYTGLSQNWQKLDNLLGSQGSNVSFTQTLTAGVEIGKITINGKEVSLFHTDYSGKANASDVYTKAEVDTKLSNLPTSDLSDYYTKEEVDTKLDNLPIPDLPTIDLSDYYNKKEIDELISNITPSAVDNNEIITANNILFSLPTTTSLVEDEEGTVYTLTDKTVLGE